MSEAPERRPWLAALRARFRPQIESLDAVREHEAGRLLLVGVIVGALGGVGAILVERLMSAVGLAVLGTHEPSIDAPVAWRALLGPPLVGLAVGLLVQHLTRRGRPQGMADVLARVQLDEPALSGRDGVVSALTAALAVGGGFSGGREGPIVQFSSTLAAKACQVLGVRPASARTLVAAGAAAGISASFNTPLGAAFFALEIILGNFAVESFAPVVAATVTGTVLGQAYMGESHTALHPNEVVLQGPAGLPLYLALGAVCAVVAHGFKRAVVEGGAWVSDRLRPVWARPIVVGLVIGGLSAVGLNEVMGNGYDLMDRLLQGRTDRFVGALLLLVGAKVAATSLTVGARTGAGLFAPSLFVGAVTGAAFGVGVHGLWPSHTEAEWAYAIVGMGAVAAAVLHAPITMVLMLFEMTGNYVVILPLMLALAGSGLISVALGSLSLEEMELRREGLTLARHRDAGVMHEILVGDVVRLGEFESVLAGSPQAEIASLFLRRRVEEVYVVDADGGYRGSVHIQDVKAALADPARIPELRPRRVATAQVDESIAEVLPRFFDAPGDALPVVDEGGRLIGLLAERDVVAAYHREALRKDARLARVVSRDEEGERDDYLELPEGQAMEVVPVGPLRAGRTLRELSLPKRLGCTVVAMSVWDEALGDWRREAVDIDRVLRGEDKLIVIGPADALRRLEEGLDAA